MAAEPATRLAIGLLAWSAFSAETPDPAWGEVLRLEDGACRVAVAPALGRIVRLAARGGGELLWTDPRLAAGGERPAATSGGGDKVWIWPQSDWQTRFGAEWPPAFEGASLPYRVAAADRCRIRLVSRPIPAYGFRIERDIALLGQGELEVVSAFVQEAPWTGDPVAVWSVTQVRRPARLYARSDRAAPRRMQGDWPDPTRLPGGLLGFALPRGQAKIGLDADLLAAQLEGLLLLQWPARREADRRDDRAQLFHAQNGAGYIELEWTSPRRRLAVGERLELRLRWRIAAAAAGDAPPAPGILPPEER